MRFHRRIFFLLAYHLYAKWKINRVDEINLLGFKLRINPTVFHPQLYFTSRFLGEFVSRLEVKDKSVLDMGTGSGLIGLCAARNGANVLALDINPVAVACAQHNATVNGYDSRMNVVASDLFDSLSNPDKFDIVVWNPPFYSGTPIRPQDHAWVAGDGLSLIRKFASKVGNHLNMDGYVLLVLSTELNLARVISFFVDEGFSDSLELERTVLFETLSIHKLTRRD